MSSSAFITSDARGTLLIAFGTFAGQETTLLGMHRGTIQIYHLTWKEFHVFAASAIEVANARNLTARALLHEGKQTGRITTEARQWLTSYLGEYTLLEKLLHWWWRRQAIWRTRALDRAIRG